MNWVAEQQTTIYSKAKAMLLSQLRSKYPDLNVTEDDATPVNPKFPTVYITFYNAGERGQTLDGSTINGVYLTVEAHIKVSKSQGVTVNNEVAWTLVDIFKTMLFEATMPNIAISNADGVYESVTRFARVIGQGDVI